MDKQEEGLNLLKEIKHINQRIEELQEEIDSINTQLTSTTVKPKEVDVQSSGAADPMADKIIKKLEYIEKLEQYKQQLVDKKTIALNVLMALPIEEQRIINMKYFKGFSTEEIGERIGYTYRWMWEKVHTAVEHFMIKYEEYYIEIHN